MRPYRHYIAAGILSWGLLVPAGVDAQKSVSELTLVYEYSARLPGDSAVAAGGGSGSSKKGADSAEIAVHTVYIKGNKSRSEMSSPLFSSAAIYDGNTGSGVILREVNGQKLLIRMSPDNWAERNRMYEGLVFRNTNETKEIAGYKCIKAIGQARSGMVITVFYTRDIVPENRTYDPAFRNLEGLPLEYELTSGNTRIRYRIARINLNPVPGSKFDVPSTGYREMRYEDSRKVN
ncbi:MAG TPA: hypothetical protein VN616_05760 [Puia sp.]|nr:hypothetical protein [Puia sp.]